MLHNGYIKLDTLIAKIKKILDSLPNILVFLLKLWFFTSSSTRYAIPLLPPCYPLATVRDLLGIHFVYTQNTLRLYEKHLVPLHGISSPERKINGFPVNLFLALSEILTMLSTKLQKNHLYQYKSVRPRRARTPKEHLRKTKETPKEDSSILLLPPCYPLAIPLLSPCYDCRRICFRRP